MNSLIKNRLRVFYCQLLVCFQPRSTDPDISRQEFILNILLGAIIALLGIAFFFRIFFYPTDIETYSNNGLPLLVLFGVLLFFISLYFLSRKGFFRLASYIFLSVIFLLVAYMMLTWGVDVNAGLLLTTLIIVMSGILINTRFAFVLTGIIAITMIAVDFLQRSQVISMNRYWRSEPWTYTDTAMTIVIFLIIATVSWLSNREIEKSLTRARKSEADLKNERDFLEVKVDQRTKELKEVQAEKMTQLYRFAEFGRISSGLFHDLINPLNAVSLNLGKVNVTDKGDDDLPIEETKQFVNNAVRAAKKLEDLVVAVRKQLAREETKTLFLIEEEIQHVIDVLSHKAQKAGVELRFTPCRTLKRSTGEIYIFGDAIKFNQVVLNLITNGIDACVEVTPVGIPTRWVEVLVVLESELVAMSVEDNGVGILEHHIDKIFEPFFTTKINGQGIGIGLSIAKRIVEKDFRGSLVVKSEAGRGSSFKVSLPVRKQVTEYA